MEKDKFVLFLDSGIGGLSTFFDTKKILKNQNFVYVADFKNSPYGTKTKSELQKILTDVLEVFCKKYKPICVVLACNTATTTCISWLRKHFSVPFVGAEPAVLPPIAQGYKKILVLCTPATKKHSKLLGKHLDTLVFCCPKTLATKVEQNFNNLGGLMPYLKRLLKRFVGKIDAVVLGCTHYVFLKEQIQQIFSEAKVFDGNCGIARQVKNVVQKSAESNCLNKKSKIFLISTDKTRQSFLEYANDHLSKS